MESLQNQIGLDSSSKLIKGIGTYQNPNAKGDTRRTLLNVTKIALHIILNVTIASGAGVLAIFFPYSLIATVPLAGVVFAWSLYEITELVKEMQGRKNLAPSTSQLPNHLDAVPLEEWDESIEGCYPFKDCMETYECKKKLIQNAKQEILISGSYCGKKAFDEILDLIDQQMEKEPQLRTYILTATRFVTDKNGCRNWKNLEMLTKKYPDRFYVEFSFETKQMNPDEPGYKYISNHTKLMVVDRKAMITGGSGIEDRWAYTDGISTQETAEERGFVNASIAKTFRDKDFILHSEKKGGSIDRSVEEFYKLFSRWHHYCSTVEKNHRRISLINGRRNKKIRSFHDFYQDLNPEKPTLNIKDILSESVKCERVKVFMLGPEQVSNTLEKELIEKINQAQKDITISHMYIHPTKDVRKALKAAAKRGVQITFLTNHYTDNSPLAHKAFAPRSIFNVRRIARAQRDYNVSLYYWNANKSTNHQKVVMIDDRYVLCGSSNLGYKGLYSMSDYEHNLLIDSKELCARVKQDFIQDLRYAELYSPEELKKRPSISELFYSWLHLQASPKIG